MHFHKSVPKMVRASLISALYVVLCLLFAPFSFGAVQVRVSEALTLLPILCPEAVVGVVIGCFLANMLGGAPIDMVVGTFATLLAALATRKLRHIRWRGLPLLASVPPVLFNAVIVGIELTILYYSNATVPIYLLNMATVGIGQIISSCVLGVALIKGIEKTPVLHKLFAE